MRRKPSRRITRFGFETLDERLLLSTLVAIVDTGVDLNSSADAPYYDLAKGYNAYTQQASTADGSNVADNSAGPGNHGHGSAVADSVVMGIKDTVAQPGAAGADVKIMPIRVTSDSGNLDGNTYGAVVRGIFYAAYHHASVINVSIVFLSLSDVPAHVPNNPDPSYTKTSATFQDAIDYARSKGAIVVTGAGNNHYDLDSTNTDQNGHYPLHLFPSWNTGPTLIVAASTEPSGDLTSVSNFGATHVTLGAPAIQNATSYAAGYVTGVTGVIAALNPGLSADGIAGLIKSSAQIYPQLQGKVSTGAVISPANAVAASVVNVKPTVVAGAAAFPATVTGSSTNLGVLGMSTGGESGLTYTWSVINGPAVTFSPAGVNGTNAGKNVTAHFNQPGSYTFQARIATATGASVTSQVTVNVSAVATSVEVTSSGATVSAGGTQSFSALARDQFGGPLAPQPQIAWSVNPGGAGGAIDASGKYSAPATGSGEDTVRASAGPVAGTGVVRVIAGAPGDVPASPRIEAVSLDQDGHDFANIRDLVRAVPGPDGLQDVHIRLSNLPEDTPITRVAVNRSGGNGLYRSDGSPWSWSTVVNRASTAPGRYSPSADVYFQPNSKVHDDDHEYQVYIYLAGQTLPVLRFVHVSDDPALPHTTPVPPPPIQAVSLGQDGSDFANIFDRIRAVPGPDGLQDVHIRLSNLPQDAQIERVRVNRSGGGGLYRSDGSPWAWSTVVARANLPSGRYSESADVYFQPNPNVVDVNHEYHVEVYFAGQTNPASLFVYVTDDPLLRKKKASAT